MSFNCCNCTKYKGCSSLSMTASGFEIPMNWKNVKIFVHFECFHMNDDKDKDQGYKGKSTVHHDSMRVFNQVLSSIWKKVMKWENSNYEIYG